MYLDNPVIYVNQYVINIVNCIDMVGVIVNYCKYLYLVVVLFCSSLLL